MKKCLCLLVFVLSLSSHGGILIEPVLGFAKSISGKEKYFDNSLSYASPFYGARLGFSKLGFQGGIDVTHQSSKLDRKKGGLTTEEDFTRTDMALFAGFKFPLLFRVFGKYIFNSNFKIDNQKINDPTGFSLGMGFSFGIPLTGFFLPSLSINAEYRHLTWDKPKHIKDLDLTASAKKLPSGANLSDVLFSVSLPWSF